MTDVPTHIPGLTAEVEKAAKPDKASPVVPVKRTSKSHNPVPGMDLSKVAVSAIPAPPFS